MKDDREKKVSLKEFEKFCKRVNDPEFDTISDAELWTVISEIQLQRKLQEYTEQLDEMEERFRDLAYESTHNAVEQVDDTDSDEQNETKQVGDADSGAKKGENTVADKFGLDQQSIRKFKAKQSDKVKLNDYLQRRIIRKNIETLFSEKGYEFFQSLVFVLIVGVLAVLVVEYAYFDELLAEVRVAIEERERYEKSAALNYADFEVFRQAVKRAKETGEPIENAEERKQRLIDEGAWKESDKVEDSVRSSYSSSSIS